MALNREAIYGAIYTRLAALTASGFITVSRRLMHVNDVGPSLQPALFMAQTAQSASYDTGRTTMWTLGVDIYVYAKTPPTSGSPGPTLNPLLDAIELAFKPDNANVNACTLGGLVQYVRLGAIETDEGTLGDQSIAIIPLEILAIA